MKGEEKHLTVYNPPETEVEKVLKDVLLLTKKVEGIESQVEDTKVEVKATKAAVMTNFEIQAALQHHGPSPMHLRNVFSRSKGYKPLIRRGQEL